ncbi:MAG: DNA-3-methyladenine glycosylase 2 family protein [Rhodospirillales bacterium]|nr:DNA-3-methyladenine glycosylase 2 family protein [Rhodospirillales bacterium]
MVRITKATFREGAEELAARDADFSRLLKAADLPSLRSRQTGFGSLIKIISGQQVSTAAARAINGRLDQIANPLTPEAFAKLSADDLRTIGFSRQKTSYGQGIAEAVLSGEFSFRKIARMDDEAAIEAMIALKGVGRWTAEVYLLFALRRPDIWPVGDLGIVIGAEGLKKLKGRPDPKQLQKMGEAWRPWRSVAARLLWHYVDVQRRGLIDTAPG